jgi:hypothetical protein
MTLFYVIQFLAAGTSIVAMKDSFSASKWHDCHQCGGCKRMKCKQCRGFGKVVGQFPEDEFDKNGKFLGYEPKIEQGDMWPCRFCQQEGTVQCTTCMGVGGEVSKTIIDWSRVTGTKMAFQQYRFKNAFDKYYGSPVEPAYLEVKEYERLKKMDPRSMRKEKEKNPLNKLYGLVKGIAGDQYSGKIEPKLKKYVDRVKRQLRRADIRFGIKHPGVGPVNESASSSKSSSSSKTVQQTNKKKTGGDGDAKKQADDKEKKKKIDAANAKAKKAKADEKKKNDAAKAKAKAKKK